jgi:hypothetical protein
MERSFSEFWANYFPKTGAKIGEGIKRPGSEQMTAQRETPDMFVIKMFAQVVNV